MTVDEFLVRTVREHCVACAESKWDYDCAEENRFELDAADGCTFGPVSAEECLAERWSCNDVAAPVVFPQGGPACDLVFDCP